MTRGRNLRVAMHLFGYGGIHPHAHDSTFGEFTYTPNGDIEWMHRVIDDDALIDRSRSRSASRVLAMGGDALVMIDHDIQWKPGDVGNMAKKAIELNAIVGGLYACRSLRTGFSSRLAAQGVKWTEGGTTCHKAEYVATGFIAIPIRALERIRGVCTRPDAPPEMKLTECMGLDANDPPFWDFFRPIAVPSTMKGYEGKNEYLSEDWAFAARARFSEVPLYIYEAPTLVHWGPYGFTIGDGLRQPRKGEK